MATRARNARTTTATSKKRHSPAGAAAAGDRHARADGGARWPQLKLEIVRDYGGAYSKILSRQAGLAYHYIEGFSGARALARADAFAPGNPLNALNVQPPFHHHHLVDLDGGRAVALRKLVGERPDVTLHQGNANGILRHDVFPQIRAEDYRRALCVLDPVEFDWRVIEAAGRLRTIDLFVHLPADGAPAHAAAFGRRLREEARFDNVLPPLAVNDADGNVASHLFFASRNDTANHVIAEIFARHGGAGSETAGRRA